MMQSIFWTGRLLSRALRNGLSNLSSAAELSVSKKHPYLVSVVCGFPKDIANGRTQKGQFGDDAWFSTNFNNADVIGVADGVGGWRAYGIDPGQFSSYLMRTCERLVQMGHFKLSEPGDLLAKSYYELLEHKKPILGSSTACVMILDRNESVMRAANIGDSGYMVVRGGRVVHRSHEQQHYFNTPYQLSLPPPGHDRNVLSDRPESADTSEFPVECGDVILVATDGVFDNVPEPVLVAEMRRATELAGDSQQLQGVANSIAWMARNLSFDGCYMSPFAKSARQNGIDAIGVADGVGGWRAYGIDPGQFSSYLMRTCERLVQMGHFKLSEPGDLLAKSYYELLEHKKPILGSSTACVMILDRNESVMRAANIGDSGYMVVRGGRVVHRSHEQQHYFNTPYQLSLPPPGHDRNVLSDRPESADTSEFPVECGDVILVATDGVFDNVPEPVLVAEMRRATELAGDSQQLQGVANSIAWMARNLSFDGCYMSPFAKSARQNGIDAIGGKPDDITVLLAIVAL